VPPTMSSFRLYPADFRTRRRPLECLAPITQKNSPAPPSDDDDVVRCRRPTTLGPNCPPDAVFAPMATSGPDGNHSQLFDEWCQLHQFSL